MDKFTAISASSSSRIYISDDGVNNWCLESTVSERCGQGENSSMLTLGCPYPSTELAHSLVHSSLVPQ